jgi:hypothetical protein
VSSHHDGVNFYFQSIVLADRPQLSLAGSAVSKSLVRELVNQLGLLSSIYHHDRSSFLSSESEPVSSLAVPLQITESSEAGGMVAPTDVGDLLDLDWSGDTASPDGNTLPVSSFPGLTDLFGSQLDPNTMNSTFQPPVSNNMDDLFATTLSPNNSTPMSAQSTNKPTNDLDWML